MEHGSYDHGSYDNTDGTTFLLRSRQKPIFSMYFTTVITTFYHGLYDNTDDPTYLSWSQMHFYHGSYDIFSPHSRVIQKSLYYEQKWQFFSRFLDYKISWISRNLKTHENPNIFEFYFNSLLNVGLTVVNFEKLPKMSYEPWHFYPTTRMIRHFSAGPLRCRRNRVPLYLLLIYAVRAHQSLQGDLFTSLSLTAA